MKFKRIVKRKIDDSRGGTREVYFWEDGEEIKPGLYRVRIPRFSVGSLRWYTTRNEMFIWNNQSEEVIHDMFVDRRIDLLNLPEVFPCHEHTFLLTESYLGDVGMKKLLSRITLEGTRV